MKNPLSIPALRTFLLACALVVIAPFAHCADLTVAVHDKPPYAFKDEEGHWVGLGIELWEAVAKQQNWTYQYQELPAEDLIGALAGKKVDLVVGELLVNSLDEKIMDFSQPFLDSSVGVAVSASNWHPSWFQILVHAFDWTLVRIFLWFVPVMLIVSVLVWLLERHRIDGHFTGRPAHGLGSAFWFAAVTMTTTGYGDKVPVTFLGRALSVIWMFMSLLLVTAFTASVASTVATVRSSTLVRSAADLRHYRNGIQPGGVATQILDRYSAPTVTFETYEEALKNLEDGTIDTVVGDSNSLQYLISQGSADSVVLLPMKLFASRIAFGMPQGSTIVEPFNISLLNLIHSPAWPAILQQYLGSTALAPADATHPSVSTTNQ